MKKLLYGFFTSIVLIFNLNGAGAQAPVITYASPKVYITGVAISPLGPNNTGGAVGSYGAVTTFKSMNSPYSIVLDASNNVFATDNVDGDLYKFTPAGVGGTIYLSLNAPNGIADDASGNIWVCNTGNNTVCKFSPTGTLLTTIAGFSTPYGITIDNSNNVFVVDNGTGSIIEIPAGTTTISTFLTGFTNPYGVDIDASGNVFVSQITSNSIIEVASGSTTHTTFATGFNSPRNIEPDGFGNLYVADFGNNVIKRVTSAGAVSTIITGLSSPRDVDIDATGNIYIADFGTNTIKKSVGTGYAVTNGTLPAGLFLNAYTGFISGTPTTVAAATNITVTATNGTGSSSATFSIAVNSAAPAITYASPQVYAVNVAIPPLGPVNTGGAVGSYGAVTTFKSVNTPYGIVADASNNVFSTDEADGFLYKYTSAGVGGPAYLFLSQPTGISDDGLGNIWVSNWGANTVCKFSASGTLLATISGFNSPYGITDDNSNNMYVVDNGTGTIIKIAAGTNATSTFLTGFTNPYGITIDASGNTFVSQMTSNTIIEVAAGSTTHTTFATGFNAPRNIQDDDVGNIYVSDFGDNVIKMITPAGIITTIVTGLSSPRDVDFDALGNLYIADFGTNTIKKSAGTGYAITSGTLPAGLFLNTYTGYITGTPTVIAAATNVTVTATNANGSSSAVISIAIGGTVSWTAGSSTTAWATGGNWSTGTPPGQNDAVSIGVSAYLHAFEPSITVANVTVNSLTFGAAHAGVLTVGTGKTLAVGNSLTVNTGATGTLTGTGTGAVNIEPAATVNITGTGVLSITTPSSFTLMSDVTGSASVGQVLSTSIAGAGASTINVQRYLTGGAINYRGYRLLSSPVNAGTAGGNKVYSINYLKTSIFLTGTSTSGGFDNPGPANPTLYLFRENMTPTYATFLGSNFRGINNINASPLYGMDDATYPSVNIPVGNGLLCFFRGNRGSAVYATETVPTYVPQPATLTTTGTLNQGQITVKDWFAPSLSTLSYTAASPTSVQGYNLVGNPYASSIDWETFQTTTSTTGIYGVNIATAIYVINPATHNYGVYFKGGISTNNASNIIVSGQGFFVLATGTGAQLTFNESAKSGTNVTGPSMLMSMPVLNTARQYLRLQLAQDSINTDELIIRFDNTAATVPDLNLVAPYLAGYGLVNLCSISNDNIKMAVNALALPKKSETIRLMVKAKSDGIYKLNMTQLNNIPQLFDIWLMDAYKKRLLRYAS